MGTSQQARKAGHAYSLAARIGRRRGGVLSSAVLSARRCPRWVDAQFSVGAAERPRRDPGTLA